MFLTSSSDFHYRIQSVSHEQLPEAMRSGPSNLGFWACHLCTEISSYSLNLLMIFCSIDDEINSNSLQFCVEEQDS